MNNTLTFPFFSQYKNCFRIQMKTHSNTVYNKITKNDEISKNKLKNKSWKVGHCTVKGKERPSGTCLCWSRRKIVIFQKWFPGEKNILKYEAYQEKIFLKELILIFRVSSETYLSFLFSFNNTSSLLYHWGWRTSTSWSTIHWTEMYICLRVKRPLSFSNWPHNWINWELLMRTGRTTNYEQMIFSPSFGILLPVVH